MLFANNCNTTLNGSITAIATSMVVTSATGFPTPTGSQYFYCTLADAATQTTIEIVKVTAVSGTTFTIVRGQDGTTGTIFASGAVVSLRLVRASLQDFPLLDEVNTFTQTQTFNAYLQTGDSYTTSALKIGTFGSFIGRNSVDGSLYVVSAQGNIVFGQGSVSSINTLGTMNTSTGLFTYGFQLQCGNDYASSSYQIGTLGSYLGRDTATGATKLYTGQDTIRFGIGTTEWMRIGAGLSVGNTTDPGAGNLSVTGTIKTGGYTVATLPTGVTGAIAYVTNALAPTFGATVVGGGAVTIPVFYNGANWIVG